MQATIKTRPAFRTLRQAAVLDYTLVLDSLEDMSSAARVKGEIPRSCVGGWLILSDAVWLISSITPGRGDTDLGLQGPGEAFSRPRLYTAYSGTVGGFLTRELAAYRDESDAVYALPYLVVHDYDNTPFVLPELDDNGLYILADYLRQIHANLGVEVSFRPEGSGLAATIRRRNPSSLTLLEGDGHVSLQADTYARTAVAKVTTVQPVDTGEVDENEEKIFETQMQDWFLASDGSVSNTEPPSRAQGEWVTTVVSEKNDAQEAASAIFAKNGESHKLQIWSDTRYQVRDSFRLRLKSGEVITGEISAVTRVRGDRRWLYQAGSLPVTLTDKVRRASGSYGSYSGGSGGSSGCGQIYAVGDVFITTRPGDPAQLLGYGAWDRIKGRFLFAADNEIPAGSRGGAKTHTLSTGELPEISMVDEDNLYATSGSGSGTITVASKVNYIKTKTVGGGQAFSIMPPYLSLYVWVRKE